MNWITISSDDGLSSVWHQAISWTSADLLSVGPLEHNSLRPCDDIELGQHWLRKWLVAYRHQAITWTNVRLTISLVQCHSTEGNFTRDTSAIIHKNEPGNYLSKLSLKSLRGQWLVWNFNQNRTPVGLIVDHSPYCIWCSSSQVEHRHWHHNRYMYFAFTIVSAIEECVLMGLHMHSN